VLVGTSDGSGVWDATSVLKRAAQITWAPRWSNSD